MDFLTGEGDGVCCNFPRTATKKYLRAQNFAHADNICEQADIISEYVSIFLALRSGEILSAREDQVKHYIGCTP